MNSLIDEAGQTRLRRLADSYLRHVLEIIASDDRGARLRDFLDPWWVYETQLRLRPNGSRERFVKVDWRGVHRPHTFDAPCPVDHEKRLPKFDFVSPNAQQILDMGPVAKKYAGMPYRLRLVADHVVPFDALRSAFFEREECRNFDGLRAFLGFHFKRAIITRSEHDNSLVGPLKNGMPNGWDFWNDPFDRYRAADIM